MEARKGGGTGGANNNNGIDWLSVSIYGAAFVASVGAAAAALYWLLPKSKLEQGVHAYN